MIETSMSGHRLWLIGQYRVAEACLLMLLTWMNGYNEPPQSEGIGLTRPFAARLSRPLVELNMNEQRVEMTWVFCHRGIDSRSHRTSPSHWCPQLCRNNGFDRYTMQAYIIHSSEGRDALTPSEDNKHLRKARKIFANTQRRKRFLP